MMYKTIFHVDELEKWGLALGNVRNLVNYCEANGDKYQVEILANAAAVKELKEQISNHSEAIKGLDEKGVVFAACKNALKGHEIKETELFSFITVVPAGVIELTAKQNEGFAYIRP